MKPFHAQLNAQSQHLGSFFVSDLAQNERNGTEIVRKMDWPAAFVSSFLLRRGALGLLLGLSIGTGPVTALDVSTISTIKPGEAVLLLPAAAHRSADGREWVVPLHAWVYVPQHSQVRRKAIAALLKQRYGLIVTPASAPYFDARVNLLLADNKRGRVIVVDIAGIRAALPPTAANGHAQTQLRIPVSGATPDGARLAIRALLPAPASRPVEASAHLIGAMGVSVISDIDDTVKVTHVLDRHRMWEATFYQPFEAVGGMPAAYRSLAANGAAFHYVSSSPWHFAEPLRDFLGASGLPLSSIALKSIRLKDRTALNIVKPGRETKPPEIEAILTTYPTRQFILIGDSGEDDPEVYAEALRRHPQQIVRIYIRNITEARRDDDRFSKTFAGIAAARWELFENPAVIRGP